MRTWEFDMDHLKFDWTICQVCDRPACFYKSTLKLLRHHVPVEGQDDVDWVGSFGWPRYETTSIRCPGSGQKRVLKVLRKRSWLRSEDTLLK